MIVCTGRVVDPLGNLTGEPCGERASRTDPDWLRAAGWRVGPAGRDGVRPAMCPRCAKPDRDLVRLCASLSESARTRGAGETMEGDTLPGL